MQRTLNTLKGNERWVMTTEERKDLSIAVAVLIAATYDGFTTSMDKEDIERLTQLHDALVEG